MEWSSDLLWNFQAFSSRRLAATIGKDMNSHTPFNAQSDVENESDHQAPFEPAGHPYYGLVLRMVLWGETREDVYHRLAVNGVVGSAADRLYNHARTDRIRTIRSGCFREFLIGLGLITAATVVFSSCWFGLGFIPRILLYACFAALGIGAWKVIDGLSGYLIAPSKTGSVADDI